MEGACEQGYRPSGSVQAGEFRVTGLVSDLFKHFENTRNDSSVQVNKKEHLQNLFPS
jgi:hypothetical protein